MADAYESTRLIGGSYSPSHQQQEPHTGALAPLAGSLYASKRTRTDNGWTIAFVLTAAFCFFGGIGIMRQAAVAIEKTPTIGGFYNHSLTCDQSTWDASWHKLYPPGAPPPPAHVSNSTDGGSDSFDQALGKGTAVWLPVTLVIGIPASLLFVYLFNKHTLFMVKSSLYGSLTLLGLVTFITLVSVLPLGVIFLILFISMAVVCYFVRKELPLVAELLSVSSRALADNFRLIPVVMAVKVVTCLILLYFMITSSIAYATGQPVPNADVVQRLPLDRTAAPDVGVCYDVYGRQVSCCDYQLGAWPISYVLITYLFIAWTLLTAMQVKLHMVADLVAQWYYAPPGYTSGNAPGAPSLRLAVGHALSTGFGTAAFGGAILFLIRTLRRMLRNGARRNLCCALLNCMLQPILAALEMFTNFASIAAAITGKPLIPAARDMLAAFKRCFLQTTSVWWVPDLVTSFTVVALSLAWSTVPLFMTAAVSGNWPAAFLVAFFAFMLMLVVLGFSAGVLMDIVNTVYVLFALDRDAHMVTRPEVHQIFNQVVAKTSPDALIEQPDGNLNYGRAEEGRAAAPPAPHAAPAARAASGVAPAAAPAMQPVGVVAGAPAVYGQYVAPGVYQPPAPAPGQAGYQQVYGAAPSGKY